TGYTATTNFPTAQATDTTYNGGSFDAFAAKLGTAGGTLDFSSYLGGSGDDRGYGIAVNEATGRVYVAGQTGSSGFPTTAGVIDLNRIYTTGRPTCSDPCYSNPPNGGAIHPEYTDPNSFVGPDSDPTLDSNDEVALMASDAGGPRTTSTAPAGVDADTAVEVE